MYSLVCHDPNKLPTSPPEDGFEWKYFTKPKDWKKQEEKDCWCGEPWFWTEEVNHEDGEHGGVWMQVHKNQPRKKNTKVAKVKKKMAKPRPNLPKTRSRCQWQRLIWSRTRCMSREDITSSIQ